MTAQEKSKKQIYDKKRYTSQAVALCEAKKLKYQNDPVYRTQQQRKSNTPEAREKNYARLKKIKTNPDTWFVGRLKGLKQSAKLSGREFSLLIKDSIPVPALCPVLGIPIDCSAKPNSPNLPSVDRFDNAKGYVPGNVRIISHRANALKRDASVAEMEKILSYMRGEL